MFVCVCMCVWWACLSLEVTSKATEAQYCLVCMAVREKRVLDQLKQQHTGEGKSQI